MNQDKGSKKKSRTIGDGLVLTVAIVIIIAIALLACGCSAAARFADRVLGTNFAEEPLKEGEIAVEFEKRSEEIGSAAVSLNVPALIGLGITALWAVVERRRKAKAEVDILNHRSALEAVVTGISASGNGTAAALAKTISRSSTVNPRPGIILAEVVEALNANLLERIVNQNAERAGSSGGDPQKDPTPPPPPDEAPS